MAQVNQTICRTCAYGTCYFSEYPVSPPGATDLPNNFADDWKEAEPVMVQSEHVACSSPMMAGVGKVVHFSYHIVKCKGYTKA